LHKRGLVRKLIPKDGACLFRALSEHMWASQGEANALRWLFKLTRSFQSSAWHESLRQNCVRYLRVHREEFENFVSTDGEEGTKAFDDYLDALSKPTYWAGEVELAALSKLYNVRPPSAFARVRSSRAAPYSSASLSSRAARTSSSARPAPGTSCSPTQTATTTTSS